MLQPGANVRVPAGLLRPLLADSDRRAHHSAERQESGFRMFDEGAHLLGPEPKEPRNVRSRAVAEADPDDFRWRATQHAQALEVLVLGD